MSRRYSIKYGSSGRNPEPRAAASSLNTYDSATDNDIFALGDAATGFNIDDLFKDFGASLNQALQVSVILIILKGLFHLRSWLEKSGKPLPCVIRHLYNLGDTLLQFLQAL